MTDTDETTENSIIEMFTVFAEECEGENLVIVFAAVERLIAHLITNNCVNLSAAHEVLNTMNSNALTMINSFDALNLCAWNENETLN